ncbi:hypothetical protein BROUX41_003716 [Berkeleyomyces rouxiae]|uniref:uncharacterized protein n=1 Tax=Berkeleyomyces rouxiae TaxID=2035830 RepID=UPI003B7E86DB
MSSQPDPYKILGVSKTAEPSEIRTAYKKRALSCHPDKEPNEDLKAQKQEQFQKLLTAYETLSDATKRAKFDERMRILEERLANLNVNRTGEYQPRNPTTPYKSRSSAPPTTESYAYNKTARPRQHSPFSPGRSMPEDTYDVPKTYPTERPSRRSSTYDTPPRKSDKWREEYENRHEEKRRRDKEERVRRKSEDVAKREAEDMEKKAKDEAARVEEKIRKSKEKERAKEAAKRHFERKAYDTSKARATDRRVKKELYPDEESDFDDDYTGSPKAERKKSSSKEKRSQSAPRASASTPEITGSDYTQTLQSALNYISNKQGKIAKSGTTDTPSARRTRRMSEDSPKKPSHRKSMPDEPFHKPPAMSRGATFPSTTAYHSPPKYHRNPTVENEYRPKPSYRNSPRTVGEESVPYRNSFSRVSRDTGMSAFHSVAYDAYDYSAMAPTSWNDFRAVPNVASVRPFTQADVVYSNQYPTDYTGHYAS